jgi:hypothetical protein
MAIDAPYIPLHDVSDEQDGEASWKGSYTYSLTLGEGLKSANCRQSRYQTFKGSPHIAVYILGLRRVAQLYDRKLCFA